MFAVRLTRPKEYSPSAWRRLRNSRAGSEGQQVAVGGDDKMNLRFYVDPETEQPHIYEHGVTEDEVGQVLARPGDDHQGAQHTRMKYGQTAAGRYLKVIYKENRQAQEIYVITAYELRGKTRKAFRRRQRRRQR